MKKDFGTTCTTYSRSITDGRVEFQSSDKVKDAHQVYFQFKQLHRNNTLITFI